MFSQQRQETADFWVGRQWNSVDGFLRDICTNLSKYDSSHSCWQQLNIREIWFPIRACLIIYGLSELVISHELKEVSFHYCKTYCRCYVVGSRLLMNFVSTERTWQFLMVQGQGASTSELCGNNCNVFSALRGQHYLINNSSLQTRVHRSSSV
jgi:hypothetical protein